MEHEHDTPKLNVWCALTSLFLTRPFIFEKATVTGASYWEHTEKLCNHMVTMRVHLQQDKAPPHYANPVKAFLDQQFPSKWMGKGGPITWPPRSPDLTPSDFFLWEYKTDLVYHMDVQDMHNLLCQITATCKTYTGNAAKHLVRDGVLSGCVRQPRVHMCISTEKHQNLETFCSLMQFPCFYLY
jgi:hypothetical protein